MRFGMFFMAEYMKMVSLSAIAATLFFGGYRGPFVDQVPVLGFVYMFLKIFVGSVHDDLDSGHIASPSL